MSRRGRHWQPIRDVTVVKGSPARPPVAWEIVAEWVCEAARGGVAARPPAPHGAMTMRVQLAAQRGGAGNPV
jgi:hypothetical protein